MGLLSRLRAWIAGDLGGDEAGEPPAEDASDDESDADGEPAGLDPDAANETRTAATDDAVDALRDVRRSRDADGPTEDGDSTDESAPTDESGDDPPDRRKD
ncbi:hypothetical protein [Halorubrum depositum]|uniref:hypothetical protein n=1 Tax=Halorubrum depositum TaxID=2583992 RepID=UPI0011A4655D|nr:hypothetical protein [Halorubrum depositum]